MKINRKKLELAKARACMGQKEIVVIGFPVGTLTKILGVDVLEIIKTE